MSETPMPPEPGDELDHTGNVYPTDQTTDGDPAAADDAAEDSTEDGDD